jgi:branched-chain amino acid transport system permease protein
VGGITVGLIYALMALGLTLVYGVMDQVNNAHGVLYSLGGMVCFLLVTSLSLNFFVAIVIVALIFGLFGVVLERFIFRPRRKEWLVGMLASTGVWWVLEGLGWSVFGTENKNIPFLIGPKVTFAGVNILVQSLAIIGIGIVLLGLVAWVVERFAIGRQWRAVRENPEVAALQGIEIDRVSSIGFFIGCASAAIAGSLIGSMYIINPGVGVTALVKGFVIIVVAGLGSVSGSIIAGVLLGCVESFVGLTFGASASHVAVFALMMGVLIIRPQGLMGHE